MRRSSASHSRICCCRSLLAYLLMSSHPEIWSQSRTWSMVISVLCGTCGSYRSGCWSCWRSTLSSGASWLWGRRCGPSAAHFVTAWSPIVLLVVFSDIFFFTISNSFYRALPTSSSTTSHLHVVTLLSSVVSHLVALFYLLEVLGDPVLPSILIPCLP